MKCGALFLQGFPATDGFLGVFYGISKMYSSEASEESKAWYFSQWGGTVSCQDWGTRNVVVLLMTMFAM